MPGPVWCDACSVASPISHASGMSASGGEHEERVVAEVGDVVEDDEERPESQQERRGGCGPRRGHPNNLWRVLRAVLFDWGDTLFHFAYDEVLLAAGWEAGLDTLERDGLPSPDETAAVFRERYLPAALRAGRARGGRVSRKWSATFSRASASRSDDEELDGFLAAEHAAWAPARLSARTLMRCWTRCEGAAS